MIVWKYLCVKDAFPLFPQCTSDYAAFYVPHRNFFSKNFITKKNKIPKNCVTPCFFHQTFFHYGHTCSRQTLILIIIKELPYIIHIYIFLYVYPPPYRHFSNITKKITLLTRQDDDEDDDDHHQRNYNDKKVVYWFFFNFSRSSSCVHIHFYFYYFLF